jgi:hypothetical protein
METKYIGLKRSKKEKVEGFRKNEKEREMLSFDT